jgi:hypothetical protein
MAMMAINDLVTGCIMPHMVRRESTSSDGCPGQRVAGHVLLQGRIPQAGELHGGGELCHPG